MIETYIVPGTDVHPEGITEDPDGVTFYVSGSKQGTIFRGRLGEPELEVWLEPGTDGREHALGMAVDPLGRLLICGYRTGKVFAYDIRTKEFKGSLPVRDEGALLNDVTVAGGHAYVTDSNRPVIWRIDLGEALGVPGEWVEIKEKDAYLNGIVSIDAGAALLVAAQGAESLWRVDVATGAAERLDLRLAADGMVVVGDMLYTCDNVDLPDGDVQFYLSAFRIGAGGRSVELIDRRPLSKDDTPTTVAHLGGQLLIVNSQFIPGREGRAVTPFTVSAVAP